MNVGDKKEEVMIKIDLNYNGSRNTAGVEKYRSVL